MKKLKPLFTSLFLFSNLTAFAKPITATLTLNQKVSMQELAANVMNPQSEHYGQFYTPEEIRELAAPSDEDYSILLDTLQSQGFKILFESKSHLMLTIQSEHTQFEKTFHTRIQLGKNGIHSNLMQAEIPKELSLIAGITGLDNTHKFKPHYKKYQGFDTSTDSQPGILPDDVKAAYKLTSVYNSGLTAEGQHIAIATYYNFSTDDVEQYYNMIGLSPLPQVDAVSFNGDAVYDPGSATETELDAELAGMMAPGASVHVFTSSENSQQGETAMFTAILDDNRAKVVNYSWGMCETTVDSQHRKDMDSIYARAVAQGVNIFVASGDSGSDGCGDGGKVADWPASNPNIVAVGGTSLYYDGSSRTENAWNGSGGGVSGFYSRPKYQSNFKSPYVRRSFPDLSFNADPTTGEGIWVRSSLDAAPSWQQIGGTSMAAPQWAGFLTMVNAAREQRSLRSIGFINPILYAASSIKKSQIFIDITSGNNGGYKTNIGWDAVTGWGSLNGSQMLNFLVSK